MSEPAHQADETDNDHPSLPAPPDPSTDPGVVPSITSPPEDDGTIPDKIDVFVLSPIAALKMLCASVEALVKVTGDVPPTPPVGLSGTVTPTDTSTSPLTTTTSNSDSPSTQQTSSPREIPLRKTPSDQTQIDGLPFTRTPIGSPEANMSETLPIIGAHAEPIYLQHGAIGRRFYSKKPPGIPLEAYLLRLHKYCPMSTAVYLATALYINRLAVIERVFPVTPRNVHRLLLAGLRVAMKALEDLCWPHGRFARVGGVSGAELGRLEIGFCFLANFELKVDEAMLLREAEELRDGMMAAQVPRPFQPRLPPLRDQRMSAPGMMQQVLPSRGSFVETQS